MQVQNTTGATYSTSLGASNAQTSSGQNVASSFASSLKQLNDWLNETPEQRMEDSILASMGLTRQQFDQMSGPEKEKIAEKVRETLKKELQAQTEKANAQVSMKSASVAASAISGDTIAL
jgi:subtilase family serine protease